MTLKSILLHILRWVNRHLSCVLFLLTKRFTWIHAVASEVATGIFFEIFLSYFLVISYSIFLIVSICQQTIFLKFHY